VGHERTEPLGLRQWPGRREHCIIGFHEIIMAENRLISGGKFYFVFSLTVADLDLGPAGNRCLRAPNAIVSGRTPQSRQGHSPAYCFPSD
jgi:hypothetical protein